jgi:hypothetical protein
MSDNMAELRAQIEAELREELEAKVRQEFEDRASTALTIQDIAEQRNSIPVTVVKVLEAAQVKSINGTSRFKLYDPKDVRIAFIEKDKHILAYHGLIVQARQNAGIAEA